jgi:putative SOS response-associated peptidase YedK
MLHGADYARWLIDPDPSDLMKPYPADLMIMWRIDRKVGNYKNDSPDILHPAPPADLFE